MGEGEGTGEDGDRRSQILSAAFAEFSTHGFSGATIKGIARAAKLQSQALIYWYFPTKEALFQAVIETRVPFLQALGAQETLLDRPPDEVLPLLARGYLATVQQPLVQQLARLLIPAAVRRPDVAELVGTLLANRVLGFLTAYLARQVELGRLRPHDTRSSARTFMGLLVPQALGLTFLP